MKRLYIFFCLIFIAFAASPHATLAEDAPIRSNGFPSGTLLPGTESVRLRLSTNASSSCRYSNLLGIPFDEMKGVFIAPRGGREHEAIVRSLREGITFLYTARCRDEAGNTNMDDYIISYSVFAATVATVDTIIPVAPQLLVAQAATTSVDLSWAASRDNIGIGKYAVYRCEGMGCVPNERIAETIQTQYRDDFLRANTPYHYQVTAIDIERNQSDRSRVAHATTTETASQNVSTAINPTTTERASSTQAQEQYLRELLIQLIALVQKLQEMLTRLTISR